VDTGAIAHFSIRPNDVVFQLLKTMLPPTGAEFRARNDANALLLVRVTEVEAQDAATTQPTIAHHAEENWATKPKYINKVLLLAPEDVWVAPKVFVYVPEPRRPAARIHTCIPRESTKPVLL
jgi:hypothetical protein